MLAFPIIIIATGIMSDSSKMIVLIKSGAKVSYKLSKKEAILCKVLSCFIHYICGQKTIHMAYRDQFSWLVRKEFDQTHVFLKNAYLSSSIFDKSNIAKQLLHVVNDEILATDG